METFIVLIPAGGSIANPRTACEIIENTVIKFDGSFRANECNVLRRVMENLEIIEDFGDIRAMSISYFMDSFNNDEIDLHNTFMSYVYIEYESLAYLKHQNSLKKK